MIDYDKFYINSIHIFNARDMFWTGGTLGRGLNRVMATFLAGALGFGAHYLASLGGEIGRPIMLGLFVFVLGKFLVVPFLKCFL